jgi:tellurite resistance protein
MEQPVAQKPGVEQLSVDATRLKNFPISFFAMILGLNGFAIAFQKAETILGVPIEISQYLLFFSITLFVLIAAVYTVKAIRFPGEIKHEFAHPIKVNFFPTISISLLLFSIAFLPIQHDVSRYLWLAGTIVHAVFTLVIISVWMHSTVFQIHHSNPAWFIPIVGNIIIPLAGVEHFHADISWFFFSIGLVFWLVLFTIFIYRIIFHQPMPQKLLPTLFIMIAPPAVGFIAYVKLMEHDLGAFTGDAFSKVLYYFALFLFVMLVSQYQLFFKIKQFFLSWWAYTFPIAAMAIASTLMYSKTQYVFFSGLALTLLALLTLIIVMLLFKTAQSMYAREICVEEG